MKRWLFISGGGCLLVMAALTLLFRLIEFSLWPPIHRASTSMSFSAQAPEQAAKRDLLYNRPSFVFSTNILYPVVISRDLANRWGEMFMLKSQGLRLTEQGALEILSSRILVWHPKLASEPLTISVNAENPREAIEISIALALSCSNWFTASPGGNANNAQAFMIEKAPRAKRSLPWFFVFKGLALSVPCAAIGILLLVLARQSPPPVPSDNTGPPKQSKFPKY